MSSVQGNTGRIASEFPGEVFAFMKKNASEYGKFFKEQEQLLSKNLTSAHNPEEYQAEFRAKLIEKFPEADNTKFDSFIKSQAMWARMILQ